jgi:hypothetical protein
VVFFETAIMRINQYRFNRLFKQLGLANDDASIVNFLKTHAPLNASTPLDEAKFWNTSQKAFIKEELTNDSDWSEIIDQLSLALR